MRVVVEAPAKLDICGEESVIQVRSVHLDGHDPGGSAGPATLEGDASTHSPRHDGRRGFSPRISHAAEFPKIAVYEVPGYRADNLFAPPCDHHVIGVCLNDSGHVYQERGGVHQAGPVLRGDVILKPAGLDSRWHGDVPRHVRIALPTSTFRDVAYERGLPNRAEVRLRNEFRLLDRFLRDAAILLSNELRQPTHPAQALIADGMALAIVAHLLSHCASVRNPTLEQTPTRTRPAVRRALEYLHANPKARISLEDLALAAGLSKHHFARAFRAETGLTPGYYVERMRIEQAKQMLRSDTGATVAEIAYELGFADHSHFTRRFRKHLGRTPSSFRDEAPECGAR